MAFSNTSSGDAAQTSALENDAYDMNISKERGMCYIFNHFKYDIDLGERTGTICDAQSLYTQFRNLDFIVEVFPDFTVKQINDKLEEASDYNHRMNSCFVCCVLTHGNRDELTARDGYYAFDDLFKLFSDKKCPSLVGKPKLFFIQACQGGGVMPAVDVYQPFDGLIGLNIHKYPDFLVACSTVPGYLSWRNTLCGSWFIQALCDTLKDHARDKDLIDILTIVNRKVAFKDKQFKTQMPCIRSTLTKDVKFF